LAHYWDGHAIGLVEWPDRLDGTGYRCQFEVELTFETGDRRILKMHRLGIIHEKA
jgi:tRNA A37 threonylcarbamoyladenosine biosynthesis protein TsaE